MRRRVPASVRTRESLSDLIKGRLSSAAGRAELVKLATRLIVEEALEAESRDVLGRDYYEHGVRLEGAVAAVRECGTLVACQPHPASGAARPSSARLRGGGARRRSLAGEYSQRSPARRHRGGPVNRFDRDKQAAFRPLAVAAYQRLGFPETHETQEPSPRRPPTTVEVARQPLSVYGVVLKWRPRLPAWRDRLRAMLADLEMVSASDAVDVNLSEADDRAISEAEDSGTAPPAGPRRRTAYRGAHRPRPAPWRSCPWRGPAPACRRRADVAPPEYGPRSGRAAASAPPCTRRLGRRASTGSLQRRREVAGLASNCANFSSASDICDRVHLVLGRHFHRAHSRSRSLAKSH